MDDALTTVVSQRFQQLLRDLDEASAAAEAQLRTVPGPATLPPRQVLDALARQDPELAKRAAAWLDAEQKRVARLLDDGKRALDLLGQAAAAVKASLGR